MTATLFVGCLPYKFTESDVSRLFASLAEVRSVTLFEDWEGASFTPYAHVAIDTEDIDAVVRALDGMKVRELPLMVHRLVQREDARVFLER